MVFESEEIIFTDNYTDQNICNDENPFQEYYKMGEWDGFLNNGKEAVSGTYVFISTYYAPNNYKLQRRIGSIILLKSG